MARDLGEVLHYFLDDTTAAMPARPRTVAVALGRRDVLRAAFTWNLAVELAQSGLSTAVVTPPPASSDALWPEPSEASGASRRIADGDGAEALGRAVRDTWRSATQARPDLVLVAAPRALLAASPTPAWARWLLLFATPDPRERAATLAWLRGLPGEEEGLRVGVTMHGVRSIAEARSSFLALAEESERDRGRRLWSYGLLVDDLDVYRAVTARAAISEARPTCRAARALRDVAACIRADLAAEADGG